MDMTEKNGQPSMEEILASIRRIIAEEPGDAISLDLKPRTAPLADGLDTDEAGDFELPAIFRGAANGTAEKSNGTKLLDALRASSHPAEKTSTTIEFPVPASLSLATGLPPSQTGPVLQSLSSLALKPGKNEPSASELFGRSTAPQVTLPEPPVSIEVAPSVAAAAPVVRVMAPFRDQHFARITSAVTQTPAPEPAPAPAVVAPVVAPVQAPAAAAPPSFATLAFNSATPPPLSVQAPGANAAAGMPANGAPLGGGIEDATAELLRPMLRQWLSENMPRMVEKALHIEVAESVKPKN